VKAELKDSGVVSDFQAMTVASYGFFFSKSVQLTMPVSVRLTSSTGKQIVLENIFTSFSDHSVKDTKQNYGSSSTVAPTTPPSGETVKFKQHSANSAWWFAVAVSGVDESNIAKFELKDSDSVSSFKSFEPTTWGYYTFNTNGVALKAPLTLRVTSTSGSSATATFNDFAGNSVADSKTAL